MFLQSHWGESGADSAQFERTDSYEQQHSRAGESLSVTVSVTQISRFLFGTS